MKSRLEKAGGRWKLKTGLGTTKATKPQAVGVKKKRGGTKGSGGRKKRGGSGTNNPKRI